MEVPSSFDRIWVIVPAYNEARVLAEVIRGLREVTIDLSIVVVDDCSTDDTAAIAYDSGAHVVSHPLNLGQGAALQTGFRYALKNNAQYILTFDADGQHDPRDVYLFLKTARETGADFILGSRFLGGTQNMPLLRKAVLRTIAYVSNVFSHTRLTDAHNGFRLMTRRGCERITLLQNRMAHASEFARQAKASNLMITEVPVSIRYTTYSLRKGQHLLDGIEILWDLVADYLGGRK